MSLKGLVKPINTSGKELKELLISYCVLYSGWSVTPFVNSVELEAIYINDFWTLFIHSSLQFMLS